MSNRNPEKHAPIIAFAVIICLLIFSLIGWHLGLRQGNELNQSESAAGVHIARGCATKSGVYNYECAAEIQRTLREQQRAEQDLDAQQQMADWAMWMLALSVVMGCVTTFGVVLVRQTLTATQDMARETSRIGEAQVRAYVSIRSIRVVRAGRMEPSAPNAVGFKVFYLVLEIENTGNSPARDVVVGYDTDNRRTHIPKPDARGPAQFLNFHLGAGSTSKQEILISFVFREDDVLHVDRTNSTEHPGPQTLVFYDGTLQYTDCFNIRRSHEWSYCFNRKFVGGYGAGIPGHTHPNFTIEGRDTSFLDYHKSSEERVV